jgi:Flp pilus assembly pilin Flp
MVLGGSANGAGQGVVEYGIILGLIALLILIALVLFGGTIGALLAWLGSLLP